MLDVETSLDPTKENKEYYGALPFTFAQIR